MEISYHFRERKVDGGLREAAREKELLLMKRTRNPGDG
jgi:hypothetical protein